MLENLWPTSQGLLPSGLVTDLRTLCSLGKEELSTIASAFDSLLDGASEQDVESAVAERVRDMKTDPGKLSSAVDVAVFVWSRWARFCLTKPQVVADLSSIGTTGSELENVSPLLDAMERKIESLRRQQAIRFTLSSGTPSLKSTICVIDARAVFRGLRHDKSLGEDQEYFDFDRFVPVVILEIVSELNKEETTHSFVLTKKQLNQMSEILTRAKRRLEITEKQLGITGNAGEKEHEPSEPTESN
jgi:hypothetical protein